MANLQTARKNVYGNVKIAQNYVEIARTSDENVTNVFKNVKNKEILDGDVGFVWHHGGEFCVHREGTPLVTFVHLFA